MGIIKHLRETNPSTLKQGTKCGNDPFEEPVILCSRSLSPKRSLGKGKGGRFSGTALASNSGAWRPKNGYVLWGKYGEMMIRHGNYGSLGYRSVRPN